jgi:cytochrome P450
VPFSPVLAAPLLLPALYWGALKTVNGTRRSGEPPLVSGAVPYLGVGVPFGKDALTFLRKCREKHGPVFTIYVAGQRMTFVLDPFSYQSVLKAKSMSFAPVAAAVTENAFSFPAIRERLPIEELERIGRDLLKGAPLDLVAERMQTSLAREVQSRREPEWKEVELYDFIRKIIFMGATEALFGSGKADEDCLRIFEAFDKYFPMMAGGVPPAFLKPGFEAVDQLSARFDEAGPGACDWMQQRYELMAHLPAMERGRLQSAILWAAQGNTMPAAFWATAFILNSEAAKSAIRAELEQVAGPPGVTLRELGVQELNQMRYLDSAIREAMRLRSGSLTLREVLSPTTLETESGDWKVRPGDRVCLVPYFTHHDPEVFEEPFDYRFDRFHEPSGVKQFTKAGRRLPLALMLFGSGSSMCPGRFLAIHEIKLMVAYMLTAFEVERVDTTPEFDVTRAGVGVFPPMSDMKVRLRSRSDRS